MPHYPPLDTGSNAYVLLPRVYPQGGLPRPGNALAGRARPWFGETDGGARMARAARAKALSLTFC